MALSLEDWITRIERLRETEGFDGATLATPILPSMSVQQEPLTPVVCGLCKAALLKNQVRNGQKYCSLACYGASKDQGAVEIVCACGKPFTVRAAVYRSAIRTRGVPPRYCSNKCCTTYHWSVWRKPRGRAS